MYFAGFVFKLVFLWWKNAIGSYMLQNMVWVVQACFYEINNNKNVTPGHF